MAQFLTPLYSLAYADDLEPLANYPAITQSVAQHVETALTNRGVPNADLVALIAAGWFTDTGWVNLTVNTGFAVNTGETPQVRKRGGLLLYRGAVSNTGMTANANFANVLTSPAGFAPSVQASIGGVGLGSSSGDATATGLISGSGNISIRTATVLGSYYRLDAFSGLLAA